jgi:glycosyltransferase involved in cell wall biosynthesis
VAVRAGALPELVQHGNNGLLVPRGDAAEMAEAIACILNDAELARRMSVAGRSLAEMHDLRRSVERYEGLMADVLETTRAA